MAAAVVEPLVINQGEDWSWKWIVKDPVTNLPLNLTGWSGKGEVRERPGSPVLYTWTTGGATPNMELTALGECIITVPNADSTAWTWGQIEARYDIELLNTSNKKIRLAEGEVIVSLEVTL